MNDVDGNPVRVLLVEDNPGDVGLLREMLAQANSSRFELTHVERLGRALECLQEASFDLLLLDLSLPDAQGFDTFVRAYTHTQRVPIIVMTGLDDEALAVKAVRKGAQDYLVKGQVGGNLLVRAMRYAIERKRAEEQIKASLREKEALLQEIHHRVKNNLQITCSLLNLQSLQVEDPQAIEILQDSQNRIYSMALVHEKLYQSESLTRIDFGEYIRSLAEDLLRTYSIRAQAITLEIQAGNVFLGIDSAVPCGLLLNELLTNTLKHAFPENRRGEVRVELHADSDRRIILVVADNGVGFPEDWDLSNPPSLGMQLVNSLVSQLDGTIDLNSSRGTEFRITFVPAEVLS
jgi:two-component sensor histidine kinase/CheY-like chemotaxis protein